VISSRLRDGYSGDITFRATTRKRMTLVAYLADSINLSSIFRMSDRDDETFHRLMLECLIENIGKVKAHIG